MQSGNDTIESLEVRHKESTNMAVSFLILNEQYSYRRTYRCIANNTVGHGNMCEIEVAGMFYIFTLKIAENSSHL